MTKWFEPEHSQIRVAQANPETAQDELDRALDTLARAVDVCDEDTLRTTLSGLAPPTRERKSTATPAVQSGTIAHA